MRCPNGIDGGPGDIGLGVDAVATGSVTGLFQSGADVPLSYGFNTAGGALLPVLTSGDVAVTYVIGANLITAEAGAGNTVFTMALDASTGAWTFTLVRPLDHVDDGTDTENDLTINFGGLVQATDNDGDTVTATGTVSVLVDDDTPIAVAGTSTDSVDEDALSERDRRRAWATSVLVSIASCDGIGYGTVPVRRGRAAELWVQHGGWRAASGADVGRRCGDLRDRCEPDHGGGRAGNTVFTMALDASTGAWTFTLVRPLDHVDDGTDTENDLTINFGGLVQATDNDGDTVTATGTVSVLVDDDTPIAVAGTSTGTVDEDGAVEGTADAGPGDGIAGGTGDVAGAGTVATGSVTGLFQSGADVPLSYGFTANAVATLLALGLTSGGVALSYAIAADMVTASRRRATRCSRWR